MELRFERLWILRESGAREPEELPNEPKLLVRLANRKNS